MTSDFDTIRNGLRADWRAESALARVQAASEQAEKALVEIEGVCQGCRTSLHMDGTETEMFSNPTAAQIISIARAARAALASLDPKEGEA